MVVGLAYQTTRFDNVEAGEDNRSSSPTFLFETTLKAELMKKVHLEIGYDLNLSSKSSGFYSHHLLSTLSTEISKYLDFDISLIWDRVQEPATYENGDIPRKDDYKLVFGVGAKY